LIVGVAVLTSLLTSSAIRKYPRYTWSPFAKLLARLKSVALT
jgi:hypothetical protein